MENEVKKINTKNVTFVNLQNFMLKNNIHYIVLKPGQELDEALENQQWVLENQKNKFTNGNYIFIERRK